MSQDPAPTDGTLQTLERAPEETQGDDALSFGAYTASVLLKVGRRVASILRWWLLGLLIFMGPVAVLVWTVGPRVTNPELMMDKAVELGLTDAARSTLIDQVVAQLDGQTELPVDTDAATGVLERGITQDWIDGQFYGFANDLNDWLELTGNQPPALTVDLQPVKERT